MRLFEILDPWGSGSSGGDGGGGGEGGGGDSTVSGFDVPSYAGESLTGVTSLGPTFGPALAVPSLEDLDIPDLSTPLTTL